MSEFQSPTQVLRDEHQVILRALHVLQEIFIRSDQYGETDYDGIQKCIYFFRLFADACHHGKEEDVLFPALEECGIAREGGPIGVMLDEHQQGRALVKQMSESLEPAREGHGAAKKTLFGAGRSYIDLLRRHINKEDACLFSMADRVMDTLSCQRVCGAYSQVCKRKLNGPTHDQLESLLIQLETEYDLGLV